MADYGRTQYGQQRPGEHGLIGGRGSAYGQQERGLSTQQILTVVTLLPLGVFLLFISGGALAATMVGLAVALPVFLLFSPVLVPAALAISLAVAGFLTSGGFGIAGLSSLSWLAGYVRRIRAALPEKAEHAGWRVQDTAGYLGQKTKEAGEAIQSKAQEGGTRSGTTQDLKK